MNAQSGYAKTASAHSKVCPSCGHCPTCGRGNPYQYPNYWPYPYWSNQYNPTYYSSGSSPNLNGTIQLNQASAVTSAAPIGATSFSVT